MNTSKTDFSYTQEYEVGCGTIDLGRGYEFKMVALIALRCLLQDFDDMRIAFNAAGLGALDDVVVNAQSKGRNNIKILIQLKHEEKGKDIVREQFLAPKGNYSVLKYYDHIVKLKERLDCRSAQSGIVKDLGTADNMYFVLFTNKGTNMYEFLEDGAGCDAISFLNTAKNNDKLYRFNLAKVSTLSGLANLDFSINFCLFAKQSHANHLDELNETEMINVIRHFGLTHVNVKNVSKMFLEYVTDWAMGKLGNHYYLTKQDVLYKLTELLLCQYELDLSREQLDFYDCPQKLLWNEVVRDKVITVVDSDEDVLKFIKLCAGSEIRPYYQIAGKLWSDKFSIEEQSSFYKRHASLKKAMLKIVGNNGKITLLSIYKCLWFNEHLPLLLKINALEDYDIILKILKFSNFKLKVIVLNTTKLRPSITEGTPGYFTTLSDLNNENRLTILNNSIKLQGRSCVMLKELVDDSLFRYINCNVIIDILSGNFNIGVEYEPLSEYFVKRSLLKIFLKIEVLDQIKDETFVIEMNEDKCIRNELDTFISTCKTRTNIIFDGNIPKQLEELKLRKRPIHRLILHDENLLEWKESFGSTNQIRKHQFRHRIDFNEMHNAHWLNNELDDLLATNPANNYFNGVNLVSASPGMGKSTLLDYVTWKSSIKMWVLNVKLIDHDDYYDKAKSRRGILTAEDHLKYFNEWILEKRNCSNKELARGVFQEFASAKQVLVMLDGFDEVSISCKNAVTEIAKCLHEAGFPLWLTTRPHLKTDLEEEFATISTSLRPFSANDQESFLNKYFKHIGRTMNANKENRQTLMEEFVKKLLQASRDNLNDTDGEFMGIPLQTKLLANAFSEQLKRSLSTGIVQFEGRFDSVHLYEEFVKRKDHILRDKFGKGAKDMKVLFQKHQQLFALKLVFFDNNLYTLDISGQLYDYYKNNEDHIQFLQQDGVTVVQRNVTGTGQTFRVSFVHRTFAEYMAALWLSNNFNSEFRWTARFLLKKRRMYGEYELLFRMFDSMLAGDSPLHLLILHGRLDEARRLVTSNPEIMDEIDAGGRSFLHMVALYGVDRYDKRLRHISEVNDKMATFIEGIPKCKIINVKDKLGYTPLDYALLSDSFTVASKLWQKSKELTISTDMIHLRNIYIERRWLINWKYKTLIKTLLPLIICQELLINSNSVNYKTTIASYCYKLFENNETIVAIANDFTNELGMTTISELLTSIGINSATETYFYDLRFAAAFGSAPNVSDLISSEYVTNNQANFNNFYTPLYWAVKYNRLDIVKILLYYGEDANQACLRGVTPLHSAAENGYTAIVEELLSNQACVNVQQDYGATPLLLAVLHKHPDIAKLLLSKHADVKMSTSFHCSPLYYAAENGLDDIIPDLIRGVDINRPNSKSNDNTPLDVAIANGHVSTARLLLLHGADCNQPKSYNKFPLHTAAEEGLHGIIAEILSKTTNPNISSTHDSTCVKSEAVDITNNGGQTPLHLTIRGKWLDVNRRSEDRLKIINFLLNKGAHTDIQDVNGNSALHYLCEECPLDIPDRKSAFLLLLDKGADVNLKNNKGQTPLLVILHGLSSDDNSGHLFDIVPHLLSKEVKVNIQDISGNTALHYLCEALLYKDYRKRTAVLLLDKGADVNLTNEQGERALDVAVRCNVTEMVSLLQEKQLN